MRVLVHVTRLEPIKSNGSSKIPVFYYSLLPRWTAQSQEGMHAVYIVILYEFLRYAEVSVRPGPSKQGVIANITQKRIMLQRGNFVQK